MFQSFSQYQGLHDAAMKREVNKSAAGFFMEKLNILHYIPAPPKSMHYIWGCRNHWIHWKLLPLLLLGVIILTLSALWSHLLVIKSHEFFRKELLFTNCTKSYQVVFYLSPSLLLWKLNRYSFFLILHTGPPSNC